MKCSHRHEDFACQCPTGLELVVERVVVVPQSSPGECVHAFLSFFLNMSFAMPRR